MSGCQDSRETIGEGSSPRRRSALFNADSRVSEVLSSYCLSLDREYTASGFPILKKKLGYIKMLTANVVYSIAPRLLIIMKPSNMGNLGSEQTECKVVD